MFSLRIPTLPCFSIDFIFLLHLTHQEAVINVGIKFSKYFRQSKTVNREDYKTIEGGSLFTNCQAHFGVWNGIGQDVSHPSIVVPTGRRQPDHPPKYLSQAEFPTITVDTVNNFEMWRDFFQHEAIQIVLRIMNMVLERLDPDFVRDLQALRETLLGKPDRAKYISLNPSYLISLAIHFNQDGEMHTDRKSLHSGWDLIQAFGHFFNCVMEFKDLKTQVRFYSTDLMFARGAGLNHQATGWKGPGRMVMVPFLERRIFGYFASSRPQQFKPFYSDDQKAIKNAIPPLPL